MRPGGTGWRSPRQSRRAVPLSTWFTATADEAVERLSEWAAAGAHRVLLQHQLWSDLETIALIGEEILPRVRGL